MKRSLLPLLALAAATLSPIPTIAAPTAPASSTTTTLSTSTAQSPPRVLFIGNSFTFGAGSPVQSYRPDAVTDLNHENIGGVPALYKAFTTQAGRADQVFLETSPGKGLDWHLANKADVLRQPWDIVIMHAYSTLDQAHPGDPALLIRSSTQLAALLRDANPKADIRLLSTWTRADQTYPATGHWHGQPIDKMALDLRAGYDQAAAAGKPAISGVIPVGQAWNRAINAGVADPNPYDGITTGQLDLWAADHYHASSYGYYLSALTTFGHVTGLDPLSLGPNEQAARDLNITPAQATALQQAAHDELTATNPLHPFTPVHQGE